MKIKLGKRVTITTIVIIIAVSLVISLFSYLNSQQPYTGATESITLGLLPNELNSLIYIADNQQYFASQGLNVTIKNYSSILNAVKGVLNGELDIATASEFVLVQQALTKEDVWTIATIDRVNQISIIGRKDNGIENIPDLAGKRIGVFKGSVADFYLGRFLELNDMRLSQVTVVDTSSNVVDFLTNGTVDAVITGQPNIDRLENVFGNQITVFPAQGLQPTYYGALCTNDWAMANPEIITRFLNALAKAEEYMTSNPFAAQSIIQNHLNYTAQYTDEIWSDHQFSLSLDQSLVLAMESEARWVMSNNLTNQTVIPDFLMYLYLDGLSSIKLGSVNVIR